ncbi:hypothetical protein HYV73_02295 [Candidatus Uhrbacteria bacterium]|nr:hypothetical protein [Candidatus Uhrbacteria bacterium]
MYIFWLEFTHYVMAVFAVLVCVSSASLFLTTYKYEKQLKTVWRIIGFFSLAFAFFLFILERKYPGLGLPALAVQLFGFFSIYKGVLAEPSLIHLQRTNE